MTTESLYKVKVYSNAMHTTGSIHISAHSVGEAVARTVNALMELGFSGITVQGAVAAEGQA